MAFSLACDAGKTTLRIEGEDNNVTWYDVTNAGVGSVAVDGGGTEDPSFFIIEHAANVLYQILKNIQFGDGTNSLTFYSKSETVCFDDGQTFSIKDNAILQLGELSSDYCINGACWSWEQSSTLIDEGDSNAVLKLYGSRIHTRGSCDIDIKDGTVDIRNCQIQAEVVTTSEFKIRSTVDLITLKHIYMSSWRSLVLERTPDIIEDVWMHYTRYGLYSYNTLTIEDLLITANITSKLRLYTADKTINLVNPQWGLLQSEIYISDDSSLLNCKYTCDIHVVDKDGNNLEGVTITCEDKDSNQVFSVQTDANGVIAQQTITYKKWEGTDETETEYSPHKFTFSKNGYTLLVMENVTVDARINWDVGVKFPERIRARAANLGRLAILQ